MITEFKSADYGRLRATLVKDNPYVCMTDLTKIFGITNSHNCKSKIPDKNIISLEVGGTKKKNRLFIKADYVNLCIHQSTHNKAELVAEWIYKKVLPGLLKIGDDLERFKDPSTIVEFLEEFSDLRIRNSVLETEIKINKPKIKYINKLLGSSNCVDLETIPDVIKYPGLNSIDLYKIMRSFGVLDDNNVPYQEYCDKKYFRIIEASIVSKGNYVSSQRTFVFKSGIAFIERLLRKYEVRSNDTTTD